MASPRAVSRTAFWSLALLALGLTAACSEGPAGPPDVPRAGLDEVAVIEEVPTCSVGLWKNTPDLWEDTGYGMDDLVGGVFAGAGPYGGLTLGEALELQGGPHLDGAKMILLRAAVAALLNAAHPANDFPMTAAQVIADVDAALATGARKPIVAEADELEALNDVTCALVGWTPPEALPDLIVSAISLTWETQRWSATIKNVGTAPVDVDQVIVQGYWSADDVLDTSVDIPGCGRALALSTLVLDPGEEVGMSTGCTNYLPPGTNYLLVVADYGDTVVESDETNNVGALGTN